MITENQLLKIGYSLKTNLVNESKDFIHPEKDAIVNLNKGNLTVLYPINSNLSSFSTSDFDTFLTWHNK